MVFKSLTPAVSLNNSWEYLNDIIDYHYNFKVFTTPFEDLYVEAPDLEMVDRVYAADIEDEDLTGDSLYNVSFRFLGADGVLYYAYAHLRINYGYCIENEFLRGTFFVSRFPRLFFMSTENSIEETDELHRFLLEDEINLCFDRDSLPSAGIVALANYNLQ